MIGKSFMNRASHPPMEPYSLAELLYPKGWKHSKQTGFQRMSLTARSKKNSTYSCSDDVKEMVRNVLGTYKKVGKEMMSWSYLRLRSRYVIYLVKHLHRGVALHVKRHYWIWMRVQKGLAELLHFFPFFFLTPHLLFLPLFIKSSSFLRLAALPCFSLVLRDHLSFH